MLSGISLLVVIGLSIVFILIASSVFRLHPFLSLFLATLFLGFTVGIPGAAILEAVNTGFGSLLGYIGIIVILGSIIGVILEKSGAALRIADLILGLVGPKRPTLAMTLIGSVVSIPVFCDSGFIILSGLNKSIADRTKVARGSLALGLAAGLYTTHTLIPPTPGPVAAAGNLGASDYLGTVMLLGFVVAIPTLLVSHWFAKWRGATLKTDDLPVSLELKNLPPTWKSIFPILIPILLISVAAALKFAEIEHSFWSFLGQPVIALLIGVAFAFSLFPKIDKTYWNDWIGEGIKTAGPILVITGMGGAFGAVLKATPLAEWLAESVVNGSYSQLGFYGIAFLIASLLKTAQGSSTSALVITSSMLAPLCGVVGIESGIELGLLVMAIGGGSMAISHSNDSYFWVVSQFSGIEMKDAYRSYSLLTGIQGLVVFATVVVLYLALVGFA